MNEYLQICFQQVPDLVGILYPFHKVIFPAQRQIDHRIVGQDDPPGFSLEVFFKVPQVNEVLMMRPEKIVLHKKVLKITHRFGHDDLAFVRQVKKRVIRVCLATNDVGNKNAFEALLRWQINGCR